MGDAGSAQARGLAALEKARPLDKAGRTKEAAVLYKEHITCFRTALRATDLSAKMRDIIAESIREWQKRVDEIEHGARAGAGAGAGGLPDYFANLPEAPTTKPVARSSTGPRAASNAQGAAAAAAAASNGTSAKWQQEEKKGNLALATALDLDEKGTKTGWAQPGAKDRAVEAYRKAAESFWVALEALKQQPGGGASSAQDVKRIQERLRDVLSQAEALKGAVKATPAPSPQPRQPGGHPRSPARPSQGELSPEEVTVLRDSSRVNGKLFLPWIAQDLQESFSSNKPWTDPDGLLPLSAPQREKLLGWRRPSDFMPGKPRMIGNVNPYSIRQDLITDCSFVASLCIAAAFERRFHKQLITGIIYPQDARRMPVYNPGGKYLVKLTVNGVGRKVVVDDLLPTGERGRLLCSASADKTELWVSIIEKAYLKVNGGYDFPGSTSGIDLFALTGWLPEQILFEEHRPPKSHTPRHPQPLDTYEKAERVWERLLSAHSLGDCLITVATSEIEEDEAERLGLVPSHAYAVLDVKEINGTRLLQVKNPWSRKRWRGPYSVEDTQRWTPALKQAVKYDVETAQLKDNGVFWIDFASIFLYFRNVYMNWNPNIFSFRFVMHLRWPPHIGPKNDTYNVGENPQLSLSVKNTARRAGTGGSGSAAAAAAAGGAAAAAACNKSPTVWILLSRHVTVLESDPAEGDFLTMHVYAETQGRRVYYPDKPMFRGIYTNNPHTLVRFDLPENKTAKDEWDKYTLVVSQFEKKREVRYSVNVYCTDTFRLDKTPAAPEHQRSITGAWDERSAGGPLGRPLYYTNPQFALVLTQPKTRVHIEVRAPRDYQINALVVSEGGMRVDSVSTEREAMTTGSYREGFCYAEGVLSAGTYTIIVSTYKPGQVGAFVMKLCTTSPVRSPVRIPQEGEGMASKQVIHGRWKDDDGSAAGCGNFGRYLDNPRYLFAVPSRTAILLRVVVPDNSGPFPAGRPAVNVSLYPTTREGGPTPMDTGGDGEAPGAPEDTTAGVHNRHGARGRIALDPRCKPNSTLALASSNGGVYMDSSAGAVTETVELEPGEYVVVVSSFSPQEAEFVLTVYSTPALARLQRMMA